MLLTANIIGAILLALEGQLAFWAFGGLTNSCGDGYPCTTQPLFNENFQNLAVIGQVCVFYPLLNVSAVPILLITLRNNML